MIDDRDNGNLNTWKKQIPHYIYEIALSAYCGLIFLVVETQSDRSPIYDPVLRFLGWSPARRREAHVGPSRIDGSLVLPSYASIRPVCAGPTVALARNGPRRSRRVLPFLVVPSPPAPAAILLIPFETIAIVAIYLAGWQARASRLEQH